MIRRDMLRNLGLWALGAPVLLHGQRHSRANPTDAVRRVIVVFTPNGPQHVTGPTLEGGSETDFELHPWWSPLSRHKSKGCFFRRIHQAGVRFGENSEYGHRSGTVGALTATTTGPTGNVAQGPSIDQLIGQELQAAGVVTPKRSMLWSLEDNAAAFYEAAGQRATPATNPYEVLADIAPSFGVENEALEKSLRRKRLALSHSGGDCKRLREQLDGTGKDMLDFHCANVDSLQASIDATLAQGVASCQMPKSSVIDAPEDTNFTGREQRDVTMDAFEQLAALAFTCDVTRVLGISIGSGASRFAIPESYGVPASGQVDSGDSGPQMHAWTHQSSSDPQTMEAMGLFYNWFSSRVASLIDTLETTFDADGRPLMETTLVLWTSEFGAGSPHSNDNVPVMLFGNSEGRFATGRQFEIDGSREERSLPLHSLFVSLAHHMGLEHINTFGNAGSGPLEWLEG